MLASKYMIARSIKFGKKRKRVFEGAVVSAVFVGVFVLVMGFFIFQNVAIGQKRSGLEERLGELQAQMAELSSQKAALEENVEDIQTQEYQEKVLREQGLYKKEGEQVVTVLPPEAPAESASVEEEKERKWWNPFSW